MEIIGSLVPWVIDSPSQPLRVKTPVSQCWAISHRIHVWYIWIHIYHQYTPNVSIYTIHGSYGYGYLYHEHAFISLPVSDDLTTELRSAFFSRVALMRMFPRLSTIGRNIYIIYYPHDITWPTKNRYIPTINHHMSHGRPTKPHDTVVPWYLWSDHITTYETAFCHEQWWPMFNVLFSDHPVPEKKNTLSINQDLPT